MNEEEKEEEEEEAFDFAHPLSHFTPPYFGRVCRNERKKKLSSVCPFFPFGHPSDHP